jgi:serine/threonine protein kinase
VSRLIGYEATSAEPFALLEPYRGETLGTVARRLLPGDQHRFQVSLLTGLCWLATAGIAHRGIGPSTVRWDGQHVQITDFSLATVIGARREAIGAPPWAAPEQRPGQGRGQVGAQDDVWAAGRLIHYVLTGEELTDRRQLADWPGLGTLLAGVFGPPEERPSARELLTRRLRESTPVPQGIGADPLLEEGRAQFYHQRARKHPGIAPAFAAAGQAGEQTGPATASGPQADASGPKAGQGDQAPSAARRLRLLIGGLATALAVIGLAVWLIR